ncbi:unnamed protein product [Ectocarpus sp. 8 AP-2014]
MGWEKRTFCVAQVVSACYNNSNEPTSNGSDAHSNHLEETPPGAAVTAKPMGKVALNPTLELLV